jgi:hypothetical protein
MEGVPRVETKKPREEITEKDGFFSANKILSGGLTLSRALAKTLISF